MPVATGLRHQRRELSVFICVSEQTCYPSTYSRIHPVINKQSSSTWCLTTMRSIFGRGRSLQAAIYAACLSAFLFFGYDQGVFGGILRECPSSRAALTEPSACSGSKR